MKINVIEDKKNRFVFEVEGMGHTFLNILKTELNNDEKVKAATLKAATYAIKHPQVGIPKFILETSEDETPKAALLNAIGRLGKLSEKFRKSVMEELN
jgi:DNA-directed RNA polymerase subunit L